MPRESTFGPVKSRRLGLSLGVDILPKKKKCTFNCVYCEIGCTNSDQLVSPDHHISLHPPNNFKKELTSILRLFPNLNSITFGYNGEPTLNEHIIEFLEIAFKERKEIKWNNKPPILSLLTNSSTLYLKEIRDKVKLFDLVIAKLDAATQQDFIRTNRPHPEVPHISQIIESILKLKKEMPNENKLAIQCLLYQSYNKEFIPNYNEENIHNLALAIKKIKPNMVQLYSVDRIPAESYIYSVDGDRLKNIQNKIKKLIDDNSIKINLY